MVVDSKNSCVISSLSFFPIKLTFSLIITIINSSIFFFSKLSFKFCVCVYTYTLLFFPFASNKHNGFWSISPLPLVIIRYKLHLHHQLKEWCSFTKQPINIQLSTSFSFVLPWRWGGCMFTKLDAGLKERDEILEGECLDLDCHSIEQLWYGNSVYWNSFDSIWSTKYIRAKCEFM